MRRQLYYLFIQSAINKTQHLFSRQELKSANSLLVIMDYYYYDDDQLSDNELDATEDYEYDSVLLGEETFTDLYKGCIKASTVQVQQYIVILLGCGLMHRILWEVIKRIQETRLLYHLVSIACGMLSLWLYVGPTTTYVLLHILNTCSFLRLVVALNVKQKGLYLCVYTIGCQIILECLMGEEMYETIRGPQMVVSMKLISVAFDIQDAKETFGWFSFIGYLCSPSTFILGPWTSFRDYKQSNACLTKTQLLLRIIAFITLSVVFLNLSNCIIPWLKHLWNGGIWSRTYLDALSVRCSHYFICYLSHATLLISRCPQGTSTSTNSFHIVKPFKIEFPRSLSEVIRNWNIPMHLWLRRHVFQRLRSAKYPYFFSILTTYMISCLVHGFNYKVHLILISLGVFSYFENSLRRTLAHVFNACVESRGCEQNCKYLYCSRGRNVDASWWSWGRTLVRLVNVVFSLIVILQLAYLGVMLNSNSSFASSPADILQVWSHLKYVGHWLASAMALFYVAI